MRNGIVIFYMASLPCQQLTMTGVAGAKVIKDSTLDWMALPTTTAFPESRLRCLMSLALPNTTQFDNIAVHVQQRVYIQTAENDLGECVTTADSGCRGVLLTDCDQLCRCREAHHVTKLPHDAAPVVCADVKV